MCSICLWCTRKAALGCELWVAWRRKPSPQVLQDVEGKTAHQSDDSDFPQERQSSNEVNICKKRKTQRQQKRNMFREEAQRGSATWPHFPHTQNFKAHTIPGTSLFCLFHKCLTRSCGIPAGHETHCRQMHVHSPSKARLSIPWKCWTLLKWATCMLTLRLGLCYLAVVQTNTSLNSVWSQRHYKNRYSIVQDRASTPICKRHRSSPWTNYPRGLQCKQRALWKNWWHLVDPWTNTGTKPTDMICN